MKVSSKVYIRITRLIVLYGIMVPAMTYWLLWLLFNSDKHMVPDIWYMVHYFSCYSSAFLSLLIYAIIERRSASDIFAYLTLLVASVVFGYFYTWAIFVYTFIITGFFALSSMWFMHPMFEPTLRNDLGFPNPYIIYLPFLAISSIVSRAFYGLLAGLFAGKKVQSHHNETQ